MLICFPQASFSRGKVLSKIILFTLVFLVYGVLEIVLPKGGE